MDWIAAAHWDKLSVKDFAATDGDYQSFIVAAYTVERQVEAVLAEDARMEAERQRIEQEAHNHNGWR